MEFMTLIKFAKLCKISNSYNLRHHLDYTSDKFTKKMWLSKIIINYHQGLISLVTEDTWIMQFPLLINRLIEIINLTIVIYI